MCTTCGCDEGASVTVSDGKGGHTHVLADGTTVHHDHDHGHDHHHHDSLVRMGGHAHGPVIQLPQKTADRHLEAKVLAKNDALAAENRAWFAERRITALNLMSSPGSGKTTLLVRTLRELDGPCAVIEGDQETDLDAARIRETGTRAIQVNTGSGCHLEADMIRHAVDRLEPEDGATLFVENVGNLVCPALFDLGERARVVLFSTTEGEDKPRKYPQMFRGADLVLITKIDLAPHTGFDDAAAVASIREVNPDATILRVSARSGEGLGAWYDWLQSQRVPA